MRFINGLERLKAVADVIVANCTTADLGDVGVKDYNSDLFGKDRLVMKGQK